VRRQREQDPGLVEQLLPEGRVADRPDLEGHDAAVLAVQRVDDPRLPAGPERGEDLVALRGTASASRTPVT
jgi:hypothetical protein